MKVYKGLLPVHQAKNPLYKMPPGVRYAAIYRVEIQLNF